MFETVLVAGRGEIARRVMRTLRRLEVRSVAAYSEADAGLPFVHEADEAVLLGPADPRQSYLDGERLIEAARRTGAQAVHPCYGFLSESAAFAEQVIAAGLVWIGPPPAAMAAMADKIAARRTMAAAGVPVAAGTDLPVTDVDAALAAAERLGYPLMVKASAGGGGVGMGAVHDDESLRSVFTSAQSRAERLYGSADILLERYLRAPATSRCRSSGLNDGRVLALGERDCSVQRRHQKIAEETPSPAVGPQLAGAAVRCGGAGRRSGGLPERRHRRMSRPAGARRGRRRVRLPGDEHPAAGRASRDRAGVRDRPRRGAAAHRRGGGADLRRRAAGARRAARSSCASTPRIRCVSCPGPGAITRYEEPSGEGIRVDSGYADGDVVTPHYDPLLAKLCVWAPDRAAAAGTRRRRRRRAT